MCKLYHKSKRTKIVHRHYSFCHLTPFLVNIKLFCSKSKGLCVCEREWRGDNFGKVLWTENLGETGGIRDWRKRFVEAGCSWHKTSETLKETVLKSVCYCSKLFETRKETVYHIPQFWKCLGIVLCRQQVQLLNYSMRTASEKRNGERERAAYIESTLAGTQCA